MKRIFTILIAFGLLLSFTHSTQAQRNPRRTPNPDSYQEYVYLLKTYYTDRQNYESARTRYKSYGTAQSKEDAFDATKNMLESSRQAMLQYITILSEYLAEQETLNERVQLALENDLDTHHTYLEGMQQTIDQVQTLADTETVGKALTQRNGYLKITAQQTLNYLDSIAVKHRIDDAREIVTSVQHIIAGFPEENRQRLIAQKWTEEMIPELADNEQQIVQYVDNIYPIPRESDKDKPYFEISNQTTQIILQQIITKQKNYLPRMKNIEQVVREAYQEL
jgi:hypothetical protein